MLDGCLLVVDDHKRDGVLGKASYICELMHQIGATPLFDDYQIGWVLPKRPSREANRLDAAAVGVSKPPPRKLVLRNHCSPGDVLMLTAAIRDLHKAYPEQFLTAIDTCFPDLWRPNPYVTSFDTSADDVQVIDFGRPPLLDQCHTSPRHYIESGHDLLQRVLGRPVPLTRFAPDIHLTDAEKSTPPAGLSKPYWVIVAGGKRDVTVKWWPSSYYQRIVDHFAGAVTFVQVGSAGDHHPSLTGVTDLIGKTDLRELALLIHHSDGVLCPVTCAMHMAAAFDKPCVVIAGGREPAHWEMYPGHAFLHTIGQLSCCRQTGCWKARIEPLGDGDHDRDNNLCLQPASADSLAGVPGDRSEPAAQCMAMITPDEVCRHIERYRGELNGVPLLLTPATSARLMDRAASAVAPYPPRYEGRGIVIPGGGRYFQQAWVCIHMLRHIGCTLPIELWHLGPQEMTDDWREALAPLGVTCVDALEVRKQQPVRILNGWELKPFAILHSRFKEVLMLDADNVPIVDPTFLFDSPQFKVHGAIFWPDYGRLARDRSIWSLTGITYRDEPEFESGQIVVDKERCWGPLSLAMWMNEHSDFWYGPIHGDKETFHLAWRKLGLDYAMPTTPIESLDGVMCQHDFDGRRIFQHRNMHKWRIDAPNKAIAGFNFDDECRSYLRQLQLRLPAEARPFDDDAADGEAQALAKRLCKSRWLYRRVGHDERRLAFDTTGFIAEGAAGCERCWNLVRNNAGEWTLSISADSRVTCTLMQNGEGWSGRWERHEKMPVELLPMHDEH